MKTLVLVAALILPVMSNAQEVETLESCAYKESKPILDIVQSTVKLRRIEQVVAILDFVKLYCIDKRGLAAKENLSDEQAQVTIKNSVKRAIEEVVGKSERPI